MVSAFAKERGIEFPLLADTGSEVIKRFGILNTLVQPEEEDHFGIPYPGSYLVGEDGRVVEKFFNREYQVRETSATVLRSGFKVPVDPSSFAHAEAQGDAIRVAATLGATKLRYMQHADLYVTIALDSGVHIYGAPVPEGFVAAEVIVTGPEGLRVGRPQYPATKLFRVEGLEEEFHVFDGEVVIRVPVVNSIREGEAIAINVAVRYQACSDRECFPPKTEELRLEVPLVPVARPQPATTS